VKFLLGKGTLRLNIAGSFDGSNWSSITTITNLAAGYTVPAALTGIGFPYVRGTVRSDGASSGVMAAGMYPYRA
jgi:hypothetical protein